MSTTYIEIFRHNDKWNACVERKKAVLHPDGFDTIEEAEDWVENKWHQPASQFDGVWISHSIDGFHGKLMTLEEWKECCEQGGFIDYDGFGSAVDENHHMIDHRNNIYPSDYTQRGGKNIPPNTKYIHWYNR